MPEAVIVSTARTPIGRAAKGSLVDARPDDLAAFAVNAALQQVPELPRQEIVDVLIGCGFPQERQGMNLGRRVALLAGLPDTVLGHGRTPLDIAGAAAWGEPAITLRCGLPEPAPSSDRCLTVADVDWVVDDAGDPIVFVSYGRSPAAEIRVPTSYGRDSAAAALVDLAAVAKALPQTTHRCVGG